MPKVKSGSYQEQEIKKRKAATATRKKDPEKIKDHEYIICMDVFEDKLKKLQYVGNNIFSYIMKKFTNNGKIKICEKEIITNCIVDYERKEDHFIINNYSYNLVWDTTGFFGRNLHNLRLVQENYRHLTQIQENGYFEVFEFMLKFMEEFNNVFILITEGKRIYKNKQTKINKTNINALINNIDNVLGWYYANPRVDSATASLNSNICEFTIKCDAFYKTYYYKPLYENLSIPTHNNIISISGELILQIGKNNKYKILPRLSKTNQNELAATIYIHKWLEPTGWVLMHAESSLNAIFKKDRPKLITKREFGHLEYDTMVKYALNFINYFESSEIIGFNNFDSSFIKIDKYSV